MTVAQYVYYMALWAICAVAPAAVLFTMFAGATPQGLSVLLLTWLFGMALKHGIWRATGRLNVFAVDAATILVGTLATVVVFQVGFWRAGVAISAASALYWVASAVILDSVVETKKRNLRRHDFTADAA